MGNKPRHIPQHPHTFQMSKYTNNRQNRLSPDEEIQNNLMYFCTTELNNRKIKPHAILTLPFAYFLIGTTTQEFTDIPRLAQNLHSKTARDLNIVHNQTGRVWSEKAFEHTELLTERDFMEALANLSVMAVREEVVDKPEDWQGLKLMINEQGKFSVPSTKPESCSKRNKSPLELTLTFVDCPLVSAEPSKRKDFFDNLAELVNQKLSELGINSTETAPTKSPDSLKPSTKNTPDSKRKRKRKRKSKSKRKRRKNKKRNKKVRTGNTQSKIPQRSPINPLSFSQKSTRLPLKSDGDYAEYCLTSPTHRNKRRLIADFHKQYRKAFKQWQSSQDKANVHFPIGTYKMRVIHNVSAQARIVCTN